MVKMMTTKPFLRTDTKNIARAVLGYLRPMYLQVDLIAYKPMKATVRNARRTGAEHVQNKATTPNAASSVENLKFFKVLMMTRYVAARVL